MVLLRMLAFKPAEFRSGVESVNSDSLGSRANEAEINAERDSASVQADPPSSAHGSVHEYPLEWPQIIQAMAINGLAKELACNSILDSVDNTRITLLLDPHHRNLHSERVEQRLENALQNYYKKPLKLNIKIGASGLATPGFEMTAERKAKQLAAETSIANDANVRALQEIFDAKILPGSTEPHDVS